MGKNKKGKKRRINKTYIIYGLVGLMILGALVYSFARYDAEDAHNTHEIRGVLSNVELHSGSKSATYVTFEIDDVFCFLSVRSTATAREITETLRSLSGSTVTVTCSEDKYIRIYPEWWGCEEVVAVHVRNQEIVGIDLHNRYESVSLIISVIGIGIFTLLVAGFFIVTEVLLKDRKKTVLRVKHAGRKAGQ